MKNPRDFLVQTAALPAAIEQRLPVGAPKLSAAIVDAANKLPALPDFPIEIPDLPAIPTLPKLPTPPGGEGLRRFITGAEIRAPAPSGGKRGMLTEDKRGSIASRGML